MHDLAGTSDILIYPKKTSDSQLLEMLEYKFIFSTAMLANSIGKGPFPLVIYFYGLNRDEATNIIKSYIPRPFACYWLCPKLRPAVKAFKPYNLIIECKKKFHDELISVKQNMNQKIENTKSIQSTHTKQQEIIGKRIENSE